MNFSELLKKLYKKHGRKAIIIFLVYFVTKWTLTILFGAHLISFVKGCFN